MIIVITRCLNEEKNIERFLKCYSFADKIIVSDGGSTDKSLEILNSYHGIMVNLEVINFTGEQIINGWKWNPDNPHINFVIDAAKAYNPDWIIMDDMDDVPNYHLRVNARKYLDDTTSSQINLFRLYMWGTDQYFPKMNEYFHPLYTSLWAWKPKDLNIGADNNFKHGTIIGLSDGIDTKISHIGPPDCLLHYSWHPDTIDQKIKKYNDIGLPMNHPLKFAGVPEKLPEWARIE